MDASRTWDEIQQKLIDLGKDAGAFLLQIGGALLLAAVLIFLSRIVRRRIRAYAEKHERRNNLPSLVDNMIRIIVYLIVAIVVLTSLGADSSSLVTFVGLATAAITLSLQDVLRNIFCGIYLLAEQPFTPGDRIRIATDEGRVERVDLRVTRIRNDRQELILVPNMTVFTQVVGNRSTLRFRPFTVGMKDVKQPFDAVEPIVRETVLQELTTSSKPVIRLISTGPDGCEFEVTIRRTETEDQQMAIARALYRTFPEATLTVIAR